MKKKCLFILSLLLLTTSVFSLDLSTGYYFGINRGIFQSHDYDYKDELDDIPIESLNRFNIGATFSFFLDFSFSSLLSLQPEFQYLHTSMIGSDSETTLIEYKEKVNALFIPLLLKFKFGEEDSIKFTIFGGPAYILILDNVKGKIKYKLDIEDNQNKYTYEPSDNSILGSTIGIGAEAPTDKGYFFLDFRFLNSYGNSFKKYNNNIYSFCLNIGNCLSFKKL